MSSPKSLIKRKAAKAVVTHTAHGTVSKIRRRPARAAGLLTAGALLGVLAGYLLGRRHATSVASAPAPTAAPVHDGGPVRDPAAAPVGSAA